jgi:hypothetical protein
MLGLLKAAEGREESLRPVLPPVVEPDAAAIREDNRRLARAGEVDDPAAEPEGLVDEVLAARHASEVEGLVAHLETGVPRSPTRMMTTARVHAGPVRAQ